MRLGGGVLVAGVLHGSGVDLGVLRLFGLLLAFLVQILGAGQAHVALHPIAGLAEGQGRQGRAALPVALGWRGQACGHGGGAGGNRLWLPLLALATGNSFGLVLPLLLLLLFAAIQALLSGFVGLPLATRLDVALAPLLLHALGLCWGSTSTGTCNGLLLASTLLAAVGRRPSLGGRLLAQLLAPLGLGTQLPQGTRSGSRPLLALVQLLLLVRPALASPFLVLATARGTAKGATNGTATAKATANMAAVALTTVTNTNQAAGTATATTAAATTAATTTSVTPASAPTPTSAPATLRRRLEVGHIDQRDQRLARITELAHAVLDAIGPKVLGDQLLHPILRHRLRDGVGVGAQLAQRPAGRDLGAAQLALAVEGQVEDAPRVRVVGGGVRVVVLQAHVLVEDAVVGEVFLQQSRAVIKLFGKINGGGNGLIEREKLLNIVLSLKNNLICAT